MSAKILYSLTSDENPNLQKQMGCMNGFIHLFDRHHLSSGDGRAVNNRRKLPPGDSNNDEKMSGQGSQKAIEKGSKASKRSQRNSTESPRLSTSSTCSSSTLSSIECSRITRPESPFSQTTTSHPKTQPLQDHRMKQPENIKESIYVLRSPIKTTTKYNVVNDAIKHVDSPRPMRQCNTADQSRLSALHKSHSTNSRRNSIAHAGTAPEVPRWSYDGRESSQRSSSKPKELPRLSLDSREKTIKQSSPRLRHDALLQDFNNNSSRFLNSPQEPGSYRSPSNVVAKLMGLDALPETVSSAESPVQPKRSSLGERPDHLSRSSRSIDSRKFSQISDSPRKHHRNLSTSSCDNAIHNMKPKLPSRPPETERTTWKQRNESSGDKELASQNQELDTESQKSSVSIYSEIERRLTELDFKKSGKDLRALKQILEAIQRTQSDPCREKGNQASQRIPQMGYLSSFSQDPKFGNRSSILDHNCRMRATDLKRGEVIMTTNMHGLSPTKKQEVLLKDGNSPKSCQLKIQRSIDGRWESANTKSTIEPKPISQCINEPSGRTLSNLDRYPAAAARIARSERTTRVPDQIAKEKFSGRGNQSHGLVPKPQNKNLRQGNQDCASTLSTYSHRQHNLHQLRPSLSGRKSRPTSPSFHQNIRPQNTISTISSSFNRQSTAFSEATSDIPQATQTQSDPEETVQQKNLRKNSSEGLPTTLRIATREQSSPVSVLDTSSYDDESPSPVKTRPTAFKDVETHISTEEKWRETERDHSLEIGRSSFSGENNCQKADSFQQSIQKLWRFSPTQETFTSISEQASSEEIYIFEILLASGLLEDTNCSEVVSRINEAREPIHPSLFLLLEKAIINLSDQKSCSNELALLRSDNRDQRKLIFDAVNEMLLQRFSVRGFSTKPHLQSELTRYCSSRKHLPSELCKEIYQLQTNCLNNSDSEDDFLTAVISKDLTTGTENWTGFSNETSRLVLDIERLIYKDLIVELLQDETGVGQVLERGCRRHLFSQ